MEKKTITMLNDEFCDEMICDHLVTSDVKKLWYYQKQCVLELQRICEKHQIKYFALGGTLLGAVRHQGYIPWDDDIDIAMFAEDYFKFCKIAAKEIKEPFFFQHYTTQSGCGPAMARIRRNNTTACTKFEYKTVDNDYHCGIFIDIFPLYGIPDKKLSRLRHSFWVEFYRKAFTGYHRKLQYKKWHNAPLRYYLSWRVLLYRILSVFMNQEVMSEKYIKACNMYPEGNTVGIISFCGYKEKYMWPKHQWENSVKLPFDELMIDCPTQFDEILKHQYGEYMKYEKGTALHTMAVFDPDADYKDKLKQREAK